jgi:hypothetical protein
MNDFGVLNSRKRAVIALVHSFVFLGVALHGFISPKAGILHGAGATGDFILIGIYLVVASILAWLVTISPCAPAARPSAFSELSSAIPHCPSRSICG